MGYQKTKYLCIILLSFIIVSCKKNTNQTPVVMDELWLQKTTEAIGSEDENKVRTKSETQFAIIKRNNTEVFADADFNSKVVSYLHNGYTVELSVRTMQKIRNEKQLDYFYYTRISGWIYGSDLELVEIMDSDSTTLTNSETVDHVNFPRAPVFPFEYTTLESFPDYKKETTPWVIYNRFFEIKDKFGLTIHLQNQPDEYDVWIYN